MEDFRSKTLQCGCCGTGFSTWPEYTDQDQDKGYGICKSCQKGYDEKNKEELDKLIEAIRSALGPGNLSTFNQKSRGEQEAMAYECLDKGLIKISYR